VLPLVALAVLVIGEIVGLAIAPPEKYMGDIYRIMFVHVPAAWAAIIAFCVTFVASLVYLTKSSWKADALAGASGEVGVFFGVLAIVLGSIWGRAAWDVWWTWDPRLTSTAILVFGFAGYLALRQFVEDPERRATWSAVAAIIVAADVPIVWFSVRWWGGLHQIQSNRTSMDAMMSATLALNALAFTLLYLWFVSMRYRVARRAHLEELTEPPEVEHVEETA
jgi:heme exporter protein C